MKLPIRLRRILLALAAVIFTVSCMTFTHDGFAAPLKPEPKGIKAPNGDKPTKGVDKGNLDPLTDPTLNPTDPNDPNADPNDPTTVPQQADDTTRKAGNGKTKKGDDPKRPPAKVKVSIWLLNIGQYNLANGTFSVDFYLDVNLLDDAGHTCADDPKSPACDDDMGTLSLEFMNGRGSGFQKANIDEAGEKFYRVQAVLEAKVDLRNFPFDTHELPVFIEDTKRSATGDSKNRGLVLVKEDPKAPGSATGYDPNDISVVGWQLYGGGPAVDTHSYPYLNDTSNKPEVYSRYNYTLQLGRPKGVSSVKAFMPVGCFLIVLLITTLFPVEKADARLTMNTAMLLASVMFHIALSNTLPPLGYLTIADRVLIATYTTIGINLTLTVIMTRLVQAKTPKQDMRARRLRQLAFFIVPSYAIVAYELALLLPSGAAA